VPQRSAHRRRELRARRHPALRRFGREIRDSAPEVRRQHAARAQRPTSGRELIGLGKFLLEPTHFSVCPRRTDTLP